MDWFMRSDLALKLGFMLYIVFEILAVPIVSFLTARKKINNVVRGATVFLSFILTIAGPILVATPLDSEYLHVTDKNFELYFVSLFFVLSVIPFILTLAEDLFMLYLLRNPQSEGHDQIGYFQVGSGIVFLLQGLLILSGTTMIIVLIGLYNLIEIPSQFKVISVVPILVLLIGLPFILIKLWRRMLQLIDQVGEYPKA
ncbi:hypothetical protein FEI15_01405 [Lacticaseibacillus zeae]|uniref:Uncharacterized protein n=1 Tax=Lacticaseibacillus zeae TaxID=57037 RepID=A0A5R8LX77_LACZE|nr:hypothetical protein [Lacticaseibacillus zeae]TLF41894.1 hypothetical protein FEI15_01405 [Lacticaseibacillus zeae]